MRTKGIKTQIMEKLTENWINFYPRISLYEYIKDIYRPYGDCYYLYDEDLMNILNDVEKTHYKMYADIDYSDRYAKMRKLERIWRTKANSLRFTQMIMNVFSLFEDETTYTDEEFFTKLTEFYK